MPDVALRISGRDYAGWTSARVQRGMDRLCASFSLSVTDRWSDAGQAMPIRPGDPCQVLLDGRVVLDGYVDDRAVSYDRASHTVTISGRDRAADLVDCTTDAGQTNGRDLLQIAQAVCKPFGIAVRAEADVGAAFAVEYAEPGQTGHDLLARLAAHRGLLLMSDGKGGVVITKESGAASPGAIVQGENVERCEGRDSLRDRFSDYTALHQPAQSDMFNGPAATEAHASSHDAGVPRARPLTLLVDEGGDLQARADFERNVRAGKARSLTYTVSGWEAAPGVLWEPNTRVPVTDPFQAPPLHAEPMLIVSVTHMLDREGARTELALMRPGAFDALAVPEQSGSNWP